MKGTTDMIMEYYYSIYENFYGIFIYNIMLRES